MATETTDVRAVGDRLDALVGELGALADPRARAKAEEVVRLLMHLYGAGLARIMELVDEAGAPAAPLLHRFGDDDLVASLLIVHGLHPLELEARVSRALDRVRPYLASHDGDVKLLGIEQGVVRLQLVGSCQGCPSSSVTMKHAVERAIQDAAPEVTRIEVVGVDGVAASALLQISAWTPLAAPPALGPGELAPVEINGAKVLLCRAGTAWYAYRDSCPSCGSSLTSEALRDDLLGCAVCDHHYDVRRAGACVDAAELHLDPLPLLQEDGRVKVAVPRPAR
jgi:Fe-S cluster biogenesis protein NfuA/nitrite reductase/ring-hydroxylating ferredoxin subunit